MINIENLSKGYGARVLLDKAGAMVNPRERIGVVGRNGHGKTTLFRMLIGEEPPDAGSITLPKQYRIGHVSQHLKFTESTILDEAMTGLPASESGAHWKAEKVLVGLGFSMADMTRPPAHFSGGYQVRLNLTKVILSDPDLLLLDEPTNYLDITSIRWIVQFLNNWPRELMVITHDRSFMDQVITHVMGIHRQKIRKVAGTTEAYYQQIAQEEEIYEKTRLNDERKRKEVELFITRFRAKARLAGMVQSRIKTLAKMEKKEKLEFEAGLEFRFRHQPMAGKHQLRVEGLRFGYETGQPPLIDGLDMTVATGDRICVIGKNGKGKTTLLKLLAGLLPATDGTIVPSANSVTGYYEQTHVQSLVKDRTVEEEIRLTHGDVDHQQARNISGCMMFSGDNALKKIQVLSGGEKARVMLGKLLVTPVNMLLLDEPSNHLDLDACDALLAALNAFPGTVVMVTHNELFLHALAQRLVVFQNDTVTVFDGTYQDFLDKWGWEEERSDPNTKPAPVESKRPGLSRKELKRQRSMIINERSRALKPMAVKIRRLEERIEAREAELARLNADLVKASEEQAGDRIAELATSAHNCQTGIDRLYQELDDLATILEEKSRVYNDRLAGLDKKDHESTV